ncbi:MAG: hypothetical protein AAB250_13045, partial [Bdellovibrionota bacterium]
GALSTSEKRGRTASQITAAIGSVPQMGASNLKLLAPADLEKIAQVLAFTAPTPDPNEPVSESVSEPVKATYAGRLMGRAYVAAILRDAFKSSSFDPSSEVDRVMTAPSKYGQACNVYSTYSGKDCNEAVISNSAVPSMPESTVVRQLDKVVVCEELLHSTGAVEAVLSKVGTASVNAVSRDKISQVFGLFFRSRNSTSSELDTLESFAGKLTGASNTDKWRAIIQVICEMPEWEAI